MVASSVKLADEVYPLTFLDDSVLNRLIVNWILHFNDVLDAQKLKNALGRLLEIGDYRKMGGRLRTKRDGKLEIHVPRQYTHKRPAFLFHHDKQHISLQEHRLARYLGKDSNVPCTQPYSTELSCFILGPGVPTTLPARIDRDVPLLSIRITTFKDATLLGVSFPHPLMDGSGFHAMWRGWSLVLAGKENELPPVLGAREDVLSQAVETHMQKKDRPASAMEQWRLRGWKLVEFILRFVWRFIKNNGVTVRRIIIPKAAVALLRARAAHDLAKTAHRGEFISENSVLTAWFARTISTCDNGPRPISLISFFNSRARLQQIQKNGVYLQNMILPWIMFIPRQLFGAGIGEIALHLQSQAKSGTSEHEALSWLEILHKAYYTGSNPVLSLVLGEADALPIGINNLEKFGFIQAIEFGDAVIPATDKHESNRVNPPGTPNRITILEKPERLGTFVYITGKDYGQNYSVMARMRPKEWAAFENELQLITTRMSTKM